MPARKIAERKKYYLESRGIGLLQKFSSYEDFLVFILNGLPSHNIRYYNPDGSISPTFSTMFRDYYSSNFNLWSCFKGKWSLLEYSDFVAEAARFATTIERLPARDIECRYHRQIRRVRKHILDRGHYPRIKQVITRNRSLEESEFRKEKYRKVKQFSACHYKEFREATPSWKQQTKDKYQWQHNIGNKEKCNWIARNKKECEEVVYDEAIVIDDDYLDIAA
ncbi:hypothetical protein M2146_001136 [Lachnospiraceae bacterium PF1-22]